MRKFLITEFYDDDWSDAFDKALTAAGKHDAVS